MNVLMGNLLYSKYIFNYLLRAFSTCIVIQKLVHLRDFQLGQTNLNYMQTVRQKRQMCAIVWWQEKYMNDIETLKWTIYLVLWAVFVWLAEGQTELQECFSFSVGSKEATVCERIMMKRAHCFTFGLSALFGKQAGYCFKQQ